METKVLKFIDKIMELMEEEGLTQGEVERVLKILPEEIKANNERLRKSKPFTILKRTISAHISV